MSNQPASDGRTPSERYFELDGQLSAERRRADMLQDTVDTLREQLEEARGALDEIAYFDPATEYGAASPYEQHAFPHVQNIALATLESLGSKKASE